MWTNSKGVSYYKIGKKYFKNTGWLEREITENEYKKELESEEAMKELVGKKILIIYMSGEPQYSGKTGYVERVDSLGQLHGSWGGCALIPGIDTFEVKQ